MTWRQSEMAAFGPLVEILGADDARMAYERAHAVSSKSRYGLDESLFGCIERLDVDEPSPDHETWLGDRIGNTDLVLVYDRLNAFRLPGPLFLDHWQDMFCPSRDDVIILPTSGGWALFYCHEDVFEFARNPP